MVLNPLIFKINQTIDVFEEEVEEIAERLLRELEGRKKLRLI
jgi:hypothetical protein